MHPPWPPVERPFPSHSPHRRSRAPAPLRSPGGGPPGALPSPQPQPQQWRASPGGWLRPTPLGREGARPSLGGPSSHPVHQPQPASHSEPHSSGCIYSRQRGADPAARTLHMSGLSSLRGRAQTQSVGQPHPGAGSEDWRQRTLAWRGLGSDGKPRSTARDLPSVCVSVSSLVLGVAHREGAQGPCWTTE